MYEVNVYFSIESGFLAPMVIRYPLGAALLFLNNSQVDTKYSNFSTFQGDMGLFPAVFWGGSYS